MKDSMSLTSHPWFKFFVLWGIFCLSLKEQLTTLREASCREKRRGRKRSPISALTYFAQAHCSPIW